MDRVIRVLVVDDSLVCREIIASVLDREPDLQTVGQATSGKEALELNRRLLPDLITMDIQMPGMDGFATIEEIMLDRPVPILVVTSAPVLDGIDQTFRAIQAGALDLVPKPEPGSPAAAVLVERARVLAGVRVVRLRRRSRPAPHRAPRGKGKIRVVAIGASTGGPKLLVDILGGLPRDLPASVLLVQHLPGGFHDGFVHWLNQEIGLPVSIAADGAELPPGAVMVAPGDRHLEVDHQGSVCLTSTPPVGSHRPSATRLFESLARTYGAGGMGIVLTGMGRDGADGLVALRRAGGLCVAQDEASSLIFGMPRAAIEAGAVERVLAPSEIVQCILTNAGGGS